MAAISQTTLRRRLTNFFLAEAKKISKNLVLSDNLYLHIIHVFCEIAKIWVQIIWVSIVSVNGLVPFLSSTFVAMSEIHGEEKWPIFCNRQLQMCLASEVVYFNSIFSEFCSICLYWVDSWRKHESLLKMICHCVYISKRQYCGCWWTGVDKRSHLWK